LIVIGDGASGSSGSRRVLGGWEMESKETALQALATPTLPQGIRSRFVDGINGLRVHVLEAGHETPGRPCLLLLHGFPELAYSWRHVMSPLAARGYHVVAPDQRGYGRTTGWSADYDASVGRGSGDWP
jgi:dipeptidyl aminopeptidase/acylaminoacyl peptidase